MDATYAAQYRTLYENHWWWRAREAAVMRKVAGFLPRNESHDILDVGCGDGLLFERLSPYGRVEGVEVDPLTVSPEGRRRWPIHIGPFDESFQPSRRYDLILMLDVLEHLPEPAEALRRAVRLLKPAGRLLITVPAFNALWTSHDDLNRHYVRYTKRSFRRLAHEAGVAIDRARYLFQWTCPAKLAIRLKESLSGATAAPPVTPPRAVNALLTAVTRCEEATLGRLPMPFGSSLLALGRAAP